MATWRRTRPPAPANREWAARRHLDTLGPGDLVVYDRGYYSWALLQAHRARQVEAVFRLQRHANGPVQDFFRSRRRDAVVTVEPPEPPDRSPGRLRLVKYTISDKDYVLGTTLRYPAADLADLYHGRWSVEELYKISKELLAIAGVHGRTERTGNQELSAHFTLISMARLFASRCERQFAARAGEAGRPPLRANFSQSPGAVDRELEALLLHQAPRLRDTLNRVLEHAGRSPQRERPGRSYPRRFRRPSKKWRNRKPAGPPPQTESHLFAANHAVLKRMRSIPKRVPLRGRRVVERDIVNSISHESAGRTPNGTAKRGATCRIGQSLAMRMRSSRPARARCWTHGGGPVRPGAVGTGTARCAARRLPVPDGRQGDGVRVLRAAGGLARSARERGLGSRSWPR